MPKESGVDQPCRTVQGAAEHDRLASNTYRRLNLGLAAWAGVSAALLLRETSAAPVKWCFMCVPPAQRLLGYSAPLPLRRQ